MPPSPCWGVLYKHCGWLKKNEKSRHRKPKNLREQRRQPALSSKRDFPPRMRRAPPVESSLRICSSIQGMNNCSVPTIVHEKARTPQLQGRVGTEFGL